MAKKKRVKPIGETGAPTKLTRELVAQVAGYIRVGNYIETAFVACGVPRACFYEWMKKGRLKRGTIYSALTDAVDKAVAEGEVRDIMIIDRAANGVKAEFMKETVREMDPNTGKLVEKERVVCGDDGKAIQLRPGMKPDWKAAAWRAERRHPERWGRSDHVELDLSNTQKDSKTSEDTVSVDPYSIKATLEKIRGEY